MRVGSWAENRHQAIILLPQRALPSAIARKSAITDKRSEYLAIGVPEYWTVDWDTNTPNVTVRVLVGGIYQETVFSGDR